MLFKGTLTLPAQLTQLPDMLRFIWRDSRVPLLARIFIVLAPLYWISPFDLVPDWQPGGYYDDMVVLCLLGILAFLLIPKAVFRDSRKSAALGMLYFTVCASSPCMAHTHGTLNTSTSCIARQGASCSMSPQRQERSVEKGTSSCSHSRWQFNLHSCCENNYLPDRCMQWVHMFVDPQVLPAGSHGQPVLLRTRGGQYQLYAAEDASALMQPMKPKLHDFLKMPLHAAAAFFIGDTTVTLAVGVGLCRQDY